MDKKKAHARLTQIAADAMLVYAEYAKRGTGGFELTCVPEVDGYTRRQQTGLLALSFQSACQCADLSTHDVASEEVLSKTDRCEISAVPKDDYEAQAIHLARALKHFAKVSSDKRFNDLADEAVIQAHQSIEPASTTSKVTRKLSETSGLPDAWKSALEHFEELNSFSESTAVSAADFNKKYGDYPSNIFKKSTYPNWAQWLKEHVHHDTKTRTWWIS